MLETLTYLAIAYLFSMIALAVYTLTPKAS